MCQPEYYSSTERLVSSTERLVSLTTSSWFMVLCLDPSLTATGVAMVCKGKLVHGECIRTLSSVPIRERLEEIVRRLDRLVSEFAVKTIFTEVPQGFQSSRACEALSMVAGALVTLGILKAVPVKIAKPQSIKAHFGTGSKEEIFDRVSQSFPELKEKTKGMTKPQRLSISDALAVYVFLSQPLQ